MIGNFIDHRTDSTSPEIDAVFEPSAHDNAQRPDGSFYFDLDQVAADPDAFYTAVLTRTTIREAALHAEKTWSFPVTIYAYDAGSQPLG